VAANGHHPVAIGALTRRSSMQGTKRGTANARQNLSYRSDDLLFNGAMESLRAYYRSYRPDWAAPHPPRHPAAKPDKPKLRQRRHSETPKGLDSLGCFFASASHDPNTRWRVKGALLTTSPGAATLIAGGCENWRSSVGTGGRHFVFGCWRRWRCSPRAAVDDLNNLWEHF
jgi:hypothetical protein